MKNFKWSLGPINNVCSVNVLPVYLIMPYLYNQALSKHTDKNKQKITGNT
jgi:hypothetical protein